jgi:hypothetical protein
MGSAVKPTRLNKLIPDAMNLTYMQFLPDGEAKIRPHIYQNHLTKYVKVPVEKKTSRRSHLFHLLFLQLLMSDL